MNGIKCELCGRFMSYTEEFAYVEEYGWNSYDPHGGDPPELVPAHKRCVEKEAAAVTAWHEERSA